MNSSQNSDFVPLKWVSHLSEFSTVLKWMFHLLISYFVNIFFACGGLKIMFLPPQTYGASTIWPRHQSWQSLIRGRELQACRDITLYGLVRSLATWRRLTVRDLAASPSPDRQGLGCSAKVNSSLNSDFVPLKWVSHLSEFSTVLKTVQCPT